jgi:site-specific recombinase XerD
MSKIRTLKNGKYQVDVTNYEGKRIRLTFSKKTDASAYCAKIDNEKHNFKLVHHGVLKQKLLLSQVIDDAILEKKPLAIKSYMKYKNVYKTLNEFMLVKGVVYINDVTGTHADEFKKMLVSSDISAKTINFYLTTVKSLFEQYVLKDILTKNPFASVKNERVKKKTLLEREEDYYSSTEIISFFSQEMGFKHKQAFLGLFLTGMRIGELINLTWKRVDWENKIIQVRSDVTFTTKTASSERDISMSNVLYKLISTMKQSSTSDYVFTNPSNKKVSERSLLKACKDIAKAAGLTKVATLHKWRHSFNSHLAQLGIDYSVRQYLMGHKPQSVTDHYTKIDPKILHDVVSKLDQIINKVPL